MPAKCRAAKAKKSVRSSQSDRCKATVSHEETNLALVKCEDLKPSLPLKNLRTSFKCKNLSNVSSVGSTKPHITTLPPEVHLALFDYLDRTTSACLGLTCTTFYNLHRSLHGTVSLASPYEDHLAHFMLPASGDLALWRRLENWFPEDLAYH